MKKCLCLIFLSTIILFSCSQVAEPEIQSSDDSIIIGDTIENPFTLEKAKSRGLADVLPNYYYLRLRSYDLEKISLIEESFGPLIEFPLDKKIVKGGSLYEENLPDETHTQWFYYVLTAEDTAIALDSYEVEILQEMYISDELIQEEENISLESSQVKLDNNSRFLWFNYQEVRPKGRVTVYDEIKKEYVGVPGITVYITQWHRSISVVTDNNGNFSCNAMVSSFLQDNALITFWLQNTDASIYGVCGLTPHYYTDGHTGISGLSNKIIQLDTSSIAGKCAMALRAAFDYNASARANGITDARCPKVWLSDSLKGGVTLMSNPVCATLIMNSGALIGTFLGGIGTLSSAVLTFLLPDVIIGMGSKTESITYTELITHLIYHEFSHVSHYYGLPVVLNIYYWRQECFEMLGGWLEQINNGISPSSDDFDAYNGGKSELACHIESWAYFYGYYLMSNHYAGNKIGEEYTKLVKSGSSIHEYFYFDKYYELINMLNDKGENLFNAQKIFEAYKDINVKSLSGWISKMEDLYAECLNGLDLNSIFKVN